MTAEVLTFGCRLNAYESEAMRDLTAGLTDTVVVNTCAAMIVNRSRSGADADA